MKPVLVYEIQTFHLNSHGILEEGRTCQGHAEHRVWMAFPFWNRTGLHDILPEWKVSSGPHLRYLADSHASWTQPSVERTRRTRPILFAVQYASVKSSAQSEPQRGTAIGNNATQNAGKDQYFHVGVAACIWRWVAAHL